MGKIKSKMVRRTAKILGEKGIEFSEDFERNKTILGSNTMPSKKIRNRMAGYLSRVKRQERENKLIVNKIQK